MALAAGTKLDGYEIHDLLGSGGMGEVYRARDPALKREVAIKVLPSFVSRDSDRLRRFEQEAQAAAALDHPNILAVHRFGVVDGTHYLVSELLVGESLRHALQHGPLPVRKAIDYGIQIAHGLAAAHNHGIVHRDLKPENVFVIRDGRVKILDFGLAKLKQSQQQSDGNAPTQTAGTDPGMIMGTAGYMSPEQVRGQPVDNRTDIFAFGAVLYEMLTGKRAFHRSTSAETMTAILHEDPPAISQTAPNIPPALQRVVNRCLEKNLEQRFHSASDLAFALEALSDPGSAPAIVAPPSRRPRRVLWSLALIAIFSLAAVAYFTIAKRNNGPPLRISEYTQLTHNGHTRQVAGTDGSRLYLSDSIRLSISQLSVSGGEIEPVSSITVPNPYLLDVSPDGSSLLVESFKTETPSEPLYTVQVLGGAHRFLADAKGAAWSPDGKLVAYSTPNGDMNIINNDGAGAHKLASVGGIPYWLSWSPDGRTIRFEKDDTLWEMTSNGSNLHPLLAGWHPSDLKCCGRWSPDGGFFAFLAGPVEPGSQIYALDERRGPFHRTGSEPVQLTSGPIEWGLPVFSKDGKKIFATGSTRRGELDRLDPNSNQFQPFLGGISADLVAFSKDGQSVVYVSYPDGILWRANLDGSDRVQLTSPPLQPQSLVWSPDGSQIAFMAPSPEGRQQAWIVPSSGGSPQRLLPEDGGQETDPNWSPDGRKMIFATGEFRNRESDIRILDLASHQVTTLPGSAGMFAPHWSPDGQSILGHSFDVSTLYIFDMKTQHRSTLYKVLHAYGSWSRDSRSIYVLRLGEDPAILRIPVTGGEAKVVVGLKGFLFTGTVGLWLGLDPTDAPLMLRDVSTRDVYALTLEEK
jgi:eukaryotic-like serine/threonine-protein kinase